MSAHGHHAHSHNDPVEDYAGRKHPEFVVLDIGADLGALILHTAAEMHGVEVEDVRHRPVEVVGDECHLLEERLESVADHPPTALSSTWNSWAHSGHAAGTCGVPVRLTRL